MKILIAANPSSTHTIRWVHAFSRRNIDVVVFSFTAYKEGLYDNLKNVKIFSVGKPGSLNKNENKFSKLNYLNDVKKLRKLIREEKPDILHAHYASSYGFIAALSGFKPLIVSVWGSDIYSVPRSSFIARKIIQYTLSKATRVFSTSRDMAREASLYTEKKIDVTPFGINTVEFTNNGKRLFGKEGDIIIGTIKNLEPLSGIDVLLHAFALLKERQTGISIKLVIAGEGSERKNLEKLTTELNIEDYVIFTGFVKHENIIDYFSSMDIYAVPSLAESFGVAVLEASSCGLPVVATNVGGLPEVVDNGNSGILVNISDSEQFSYALEKLVIDKELRLNMGSFGRKFTAHNYNWDTNVDDVLKIYEEIISKP